MATPPPFTISFDGNTTTSTTVSDPFFPRLSWSVEVVRKDARFCHLAVSVTADNRDTVSLKIRAALGGGGVLNAPDAKEQDLELVSESDDDRATEHLIFRDVDARENDPISVEITHLTVPSFDIDVRAA